MVKACRRHDETGRDTSSAWPSGNLSRFNQAGGGAPGQTGHDRHRGDPVSRLTTPVDGTGTCSVDRAG
jgi:hypothetical protein